MPETCGTLVRRYLPLASDRDVDFILWNMTPYPVANPEPELKRLAAVCAPVHKRGWFRKMITEAQRIEADITALAAHEESVT